MNQNGVQPPSPYLIQAIERILGGEFARFISIIANTYPRVRSYSPSINPASVAANSEDEQDFAVAGLTAADVVIVNKPTRTAGLNLAQARADTDKLYLTYQNTTGSPINAGAETYAIIAIRL